MSRRVAAMVAERAERQAHQVPGDTRVWCHRCDTHVAYDGVNPPKRPLCPSCIDDLQDAHQLARLLRIELLPWQAEILAGTLALARRRSR